MSNSEKNYHNSRFRFDPGRQRVWRAITEYLQPYVGSNKSVLDLGSGYGDFINNIQASKKYALDIGSDVKPYINKDVTFINKPSTELSGIPENSLDVVFSSNLLEHLDRGQLENTMLKIGELIRNGGKLILIGPNYRYSYKNYFDDYTHKSVFTHISLADAMKEYGYVPIKICPKFLPFSLKSRLPKSYFLTKLYLNCPVHPMGKQMLLIFEARK